MKLGPSATVNQLIIHRLSGGTEPKGDN